MNDATLAQNGLWRFWKECETKNTITEIMINSPSRIFVEMDGRIQKVSVKVTENEIYQFAQEIASINKKILNQSEPILDGNLGDGSRVNIITPPFSGVSPIITIRKYLKAISTFSQNMTVFGLNPQWIEFLQALVKAKMNLIVAGGTGVGKTTFLNLLINEIAKDERIITIEDTREIKSDLENLISLESRRSHESHVTVRDLVRNTLRMRPDRIILGEVRGEEIFDMLQAMNTGHLGSMCTIHSNTPNDTLSRMENLFYLTGHDIPVKGIRYQISSALQFIIQLGRNVKGERVVSKITELTGMESDRITLQDIGVYKEGRLQFTGLVPAQMKRLEKVGLTQNFFAST